ncbi:MAG: ABC transporter permease, partial [Myxococcota bacterium]|nr:ABC transporter permease [Myxococcota bacterium]
MQFFVSVAWRNLWRNKRRSIITALAMAVAISLCMFLITLNSGFYKKFEEILIDQKLGHLQVQNPSYSKTKALQDAIPTVGSVLQKIQDLPETNAVSARLQATALAGSSERSTGALFSGVIPSSEKQLTSIHEQLIEGKYISDEPSKEVVIGFELQEELKLKSGDELFVFTQGADGSMAYDLLMITGVYKSGSILLDRGAIMHLNDMQTMLSMPDQAHEIIVMSENKEQIHLSELSKTILNLLQKTDLKVYEYPKVENFKVDTTVYDPQYGQGVVTKKDAQGVATIRFDNKERPYSPAQMLALELPKETVQKSEANIGVRTWWETDPTIAEMMGMRDVATGIFLGLVFFIAGFGILNTMLMSVFERTREIGILKA